MARTIFSYPEEYVTTLTRVIESVSDEELSKINFEDENNIDLLTFFAIHQNSAKELNYTRGNSGTEYNPQRKNNFTLIVNGLGNDLLRVGTVDSTQGSITDADKIVNGQEQLILALKSSDTPVLTQSPIEIGRMNSTIKFAGKPSFNTLNMEFYDYIGSEVKDTLYAWQNLQYNYRYDYVGGSSSYKKDCQLLQLTPDGTLVRYWDIKGAWLQSVTPGSYSMDDGDTAQTVSAELVYDWAQLHLPDDFTI